MCGNPFFCCVFCSGPVIVLVGLGFFIKSFFDLRNPSILEYNNAVDSWISDGYPSFRYNSSIIQNGIFLNLGGAHTNFQLATTDTSLSDHGSSGDKYKIKSYNAAQVLYSSTISLNFNDQCSLHSPWFGCNDKANLGEIQGIAIANSKGKNVPFNLVFPAFKVMSVDVYDDIWHCTAGDVYDDYHHDCRQYVMMSYICIKVHQYNDGTWGLDSSYGGYGCGQEIGWDPVSYDSLSVYSSIDLPRRKSITVEIRSVNDPRVQFYRIMGAGCELSFGLSQTMYFTLGLVLLGIGGVITCIGICTWFCVLDMCKTAINDPLLEEKDTNV